MSELLLNSTTAHNVDQREPIVRVEHAALTCGAVECRQYGPGHENFVANTSSVIWACGRLLPEHLCREPELVAGKRVCELGAGIGLAGVTACALGATDVLITDCREAMPLLQMNVEQNAGRVRGTLRAQELLWGDTTRIEAAGRRSYDVLLGADIVYHQSPEEVAMLVDTIAALLAPNGVMLLAYEWREDWETTDAFHEECEARGLSVENSLLCDADPDEQLLFKLRWAGSAEAAKAATATALKAWLAERPDTQDAAETAELCSDTAAGDEDAAACALPS